MRPEGALTARTVLRFWFPLAATWLMMSAEGPYIAAIVARLPDAAYNLAAYGVAFVFAWLSESPIMMLLTASNALVRDKQSFVIMRRFANELNAFVTIAMVIAVLPPVFRFVTADLMGLPAVIIDRLHLATAALILWPGAIGYRRFYQGLLVRRGMTRRVAYGTVIRLIVMSVTAASLALLSELNGAVVGTCALSAGVVAEAMASRWMARHVVNNLLAGRETTTNPPLTQRAIAQFYFPLALTSMISMTTGPLLTFFVGRGRMPIESLAVMPVVMNLVFVFRSGGVAFQEVGVALVGRAGEHAREVGRAAAVLGLSAACALALLLFTPFAHTLLRDVSGLSPELVEFALLPARIMVVLPAMEYWLSFQRSRFIAAGQTRQVTAGMAVELTVIALAMIVGLSTFDLVGVVAAAVALFVGRIASNLYFLAARARRTEPRTA